MKSLTHRSRRLPACCCAYAPGFLRTTHGFLTGSPKISETGPGGTDTDRDRTATGPRQCPFEMAYRPRQDRDRTATDGHLLIDAVQTRSSLIADRHILGCSIKCPKKHGVNVLVTLFLAPLVRYLAQGSPPPAARSITLQDLPEYRMLLGLGAPKKSSNQQAAHFATCLPHALGSGRLGRNTPKCRLFTNIEMTRRCGTGSAGMNAGCFRKELLDAEKRKKFCKIPSLAHNNCIKNGGSWGGAGVAQACPVTMACMGRQHNRWKTRHARACVLSPQVYESGKGFGAQTGRYADTQRCPTAS
eukprot:gene13627-biopygen23061